ncbi:hypothetical protein [Haloplanus sp.]|uniref:hypothetical protein n=1 Tax=Haloplanus sp. TaxID=1961696 RepID=UPI002628B660|nr:hypothetical protein [Haloplanus sp.]
MASLREFFIANTVALLSMRILQLFIWLETSVPFIEGQKFTITAVSIGVAYGVETGVVLLASGILKESIKNEYEDELFTDFLKVFSLIVFSYILLNNSTATQELLTRVVYFVFFIVYFVSGLISLSTDTTQLKELDKVSAIMMFLFLITPLSIIGILVAYVAALLPTYSVLIFSVLSLILVIFWLYRVIDYDIGPILS